MDPTEIRRRMESVPDKWTLAWWQKHYEEIKTGYRGATHSVNRCVAEYEDVSETIDKLWHHMERLEQEIDEANATIGELRGTVVALQDRIDRMAVWIKDNVPTNGRDNATIG